jgi:hypothetical protein
MDLSQDETDFYYNTVKNFSRFLAKNLFRLIKVGLQQFSRLISLVFYPPSQKTTRFPVDECKNPLCYGEMSPRLVTP